MTMNTMTMTSETTDNTTQPQEPKEAQDTSDAGSASAGDPFEGVACSPDGIPLIVLKALQRPDAFQLFLDVLLAEIGDNPALRMRAHFLLMWGLAHGQYRLPDDAPSSRATTPPSSASPSPDARAAGEERLAARRQADEQHMAARRQAHEQALVVLDQNGDVAIDYGEALHLITVLQRAIAAHDITLFGDGSQAQPIDAHEGYNLMRNDAEALAHLAKTLYESEWRSSRRIEAGVSIDD